MDVRKLRYLCEYAVFRSVACLLQILSVRQTASLAEALGWLFVRVLPRKLSRYHVARENIEQSFPELSPAEVDDLIRRMWVHLFRLIAETVQLPRKMTLDNCREVITFRDRRKCVKAMCSGRPVLMLGGHFGNWEVSTATFGLFGFPMGIVGRELDNPYLHRWFYESRQQTGHKLYLKKGASDGMVQLMDAGGNLGVLCDQDAGRRGVFVDFFGRPASTFKSIALMALQYNAIIVVGYGIRTKDDFVNGRWSQFEIGCEEIIDPAEIEADDEIREITQRFTSALERAIRRAPEQYFWVHRRWKTDPITRRKAKKKKQKPHVAPAA